MTVMVRNYLIRSALLLTAVLGVLFFADFAGIFHGVDNYFYDLAFRLRGPRPPSNRVVIVAVDEASLAALGRWPIDRIYYAELLARLDQAAAVGLDIIMAEPGDDDALLAAAIAAHGRVVLPVYIDSSLAVSSPGNIFSPAAVGHIHLEQDIDGVVRQVFHEISFAGTELPSFTKALAEVAAASGGMADRPDVAARPGANGAAIVQQQRMDINYYGPGGTFETIPLLDVLEGKVPPADFAGRIVLVGVTAAGIDNGILTPFMAQRNRMSGVEVHANILDNLLENDAVHRLNGAVNSALVFTVAMLCFAFFAFRGYRLATLVCVAVLAALTVGIFALFTLFNYWVDPAPYYFAMAATLVIAYISNLETMGYRYLQARNDWESTFNTIDDAIVMHDLHCEVVRANAAAEKLGTGFLDVLTSRCALRMADGQGSNSAAGVAGDPAQDRAGIEEQYDPDLDKFLEFKGLPRMDKSGRISGMVQIVRDITARKQAEEEQRSLQYQLMQAQKMEALGRFSGGIAHDFNNILTAIIGYSQIALLDVDKDHPLRSHLEVIFKSGEKAAALTRQLLAFSRKQVLEMKSVDLNAIVDNLGKMLRRLIGEDINLDLRTGHAVASIMADPGQLEQILMNLTINARDAMADGGTLIIETAEIFLDEDYAHRHGEVQPGYYVMLTVTDTGEGMPAEVRQRIFEPFFTTKEEGKGTGLGLATVHGIVKQHNGHIYVYSEEGRGTTFKIYFPASGESVEERGAAGPRVMLPGTETVLVAEDDPSIRSLISDTLEPLGYHLIVASDGNEALEVAAAYPDRIDLLLTDVIMPEMNGRDLAEKLRTARPGIKVVFMSGYTDEIIARHGVFERGFSYINKPLVPTDLVGKLREVLDGTS